ncbi:hypothetical protein KCU69_g78, partial [Aureobasidium melanogenum]
LVTPAIVNQQPTPTTPKLIQYPAATLARTPTIHLVNPYLEIPVMTRYGSRRKNLCNRRKTVYGSGRSFEVITSKDKIGYTRTLANKEKDILISFWFMTVISRICIAHDNHDLRTLSLSLMRLVEIREEFGNETNAGFSSRDPRRKSLPLGLNERRTDLSHTFTQEDKLRRLSMTSTTATPSIPTPYHRHRLLRPPLWLLMLVSIVFSLAMLVLAMTLTATAISGIKTSRTMPSGVRDEDIEGDDDHTQGVKQVEREEKG